MHVKLKRLGYRVVIAEKFVTMFSHFDTISESDGRTDEQTDRIAIAISRISVVTRGKNDAILTQVLGRNNKRTKSRDLHHV